MSAITMAGFARNTSPEVCCLNQIEVAFATRVGEILVRVSAPPEGFQ